MYADGIGLSGQVLEFVWNVKLHAGGRLSSQVTNAPTHRGPCESEAVRRTGNVRQAPHE